MRYGESDDAIVVAHERLHEADFVRRRPRA
jgi:hypothetical protein